MGNCRLGLARPGRPASLTYPVCVDHDARPGPGAHTLHHPTAQPRDSAAGLQGTTVASQG